MAKWPMQPTAMIVLLFASNILATTSFRINSKRAKRLSVDGTDGQQARQIRVMIGQSNHSVEMSAVAPPDDSTPELPEDAKKQKNLAKYEVWGEKCWGYWEPWSACSSQCYKAKEFKLVASECAEQLPIDDKDIVYKLCTGGECPLKVGRQNKNPLFNTFREALLKHGFHSGLLHSLGESVAAMQIMMVTMVLAVVCVLCAVKHLKQDWLPDITVAIPVAALFALFFRFGGLQGVHFGNASNDIFGVAISRVMNDVLIPISIFEGAYHIQRKNFFSQFGYGILFAVFGTLLCTLMIAPMVKYTGSWGWHPVGDWRESFAFAAFIADTDPVATLSVFSDLKVDALLTTLVGGEATLNDPIALVIFGICNEKALAVDIDWTKQILGGIGLLVGSIALGLALGIVFSALIPVFKVRGKEAMETIYVFLSAYGCFVIGEYIKMSGIITVLFAGLMMGVYTRDFVEDKTSVDTFLYNAARMADMCMFVIIGFCFFLADDLEGVKLGLLTMIFCIISRVIMVLMLVPLVNCVKVRRGYEPINFARAVMLSHSGFRGGMTMMMALQVDQYWSKNQNTIVVATVTCVTGMAYLCGCTGPSLLRLFNVPMGVDQTDGTLYDAGSGSSSFIEASDSWIRYVITKVRVSGSGSTDSYHPSSSFTEEMEKQMQEDVTKKTKDVQL